MLFHITHTHNHETCPAVHVDRRKTLDECWEALRTTPEIRVVEAYAAPLDHIFHITVEADDLAAVVKAMSPLNALGSAQTLPVMPLDDLLLLVGEGASRP